MVRSPLPGVTAIVLGSLILTAACSTQEPSTPEASQSPTASTAADGGAEGADPELSALVGELASLDQAQLQAEVAGMAASLERQLITMSGMEEELGGAPAADRAYAQLVKAVAEEVAFVRTASAAGRFSARIPAEDGAGAGALLMMNAMVTAVAAPMIIGQGNRSKAGDAPVGSEDKTPSGTVKASSSVDRSRLESTSTFAGAGVDATMTAEFEALPCPSPTGDVVVKGQLDTKLSVARGQAGVNVTIAYEIVARVDDDARITGRDTTINTQAASFQDKRGGFIDMTLKMRHQGSAPPVVTATGNRTGGKVDEAFINSWAALSVAQVAIVEMSVMGALSTAIESGRCVEVSTVVTPQPQEGTRPSTPFTIVASPTSRVDGQPAGGTVVATMKDTNGSVDPANVKVSANATFAYVAPAEEERASTVLLEARSKRGVGRGEAYFTTFPERDFQVSGSFPFEPTTLDFSGTACPISEPFTVKLTGAYLGTMTFTPDSATAGTWRLKGKVFNAPFKVKGSGDYTVALAGDGSGGTIDMDFVSTIVIPVVGNQTGGRPVSLKLTAGGC
jgi:hypothetical protein